MTTLLRNKLVILKKLIYFSKDDLLDLQNI